jgi:hypothetical protein
MGAALSSAAAASDGSVKAAKFSDQKFLSLVSGPAGLPDLLYQSDTASLLKSVDLSLAGAAREPASLHEETGSIFHAVDATGPCE